MFVIMRDNVVVYCFLSEGVTSHTFDSDSQNDNDSLYLRPGSPCGYYLQPVESNGKNLRLVMVAAVLALELLIPNCTMHHSPLLREPHLLMEVLIANVQAQRIAQENIKAATTCHQASRNKVVDTQSRANCSLKYMVSNLVDGYQNWWKCSKVDSCPKSS
ncbi:unnamed protein product [Absidia cylindrospora]